MYQENSYNNDVACDLGFEHCQTQQKRWQNVMVAAMWLSSRLVIYEQFSYGSALYVIWALSPAKENELAAIRDRNAVWVLILDYLI